MVISKNNDMLGAFYDSYADDYYIQFNKNRHYDTSVVYPANYFHLQLVIDAFINRNVKRAFEVGIGEGTPMVSLTKAGIETWGFDISPKMVEEAKKI